MLFKCAFVRTENGYSICLLPPFVSHLWYTTIGDKIILKAGTSTATEIPFVGIPQPSAKWSFSGGKLPSDSRSYVCVSHRPTQIVKILRMGQFSWCLMLYTIHAPSAVDCSLFSVTEWDGLLDVWCCIQYMPLQPWTVHCFLWQNGTVCLLFDVVYNTCPFSRGLFHNNAFVHCFLWSARSSHWISTVHH